MCAKEGVRLGSPAVSYIATPDGLLWTKGVFSLCVVLAWLQFGLFGCVAVNVTSA